MTNQADFLYATTDVAIWSCSETGLGITAASCATLRPLFRKWLPSAFRSTRRTHGTASDRQKQAYLPQEGKSGYSVKIDGGLDEVELGATGPKRGYGTKRRGSTSSDLGTPSLSSTAGIMQSRGYPSVE